MFRLVKSGELWYYTIEEFDNTGLVKTCFTTKLGGVSKNEYESLNLRINSDDSRENILKNYDIICDELGLKKEELVLSHQVHKTDICDVGHNDLGNGIIRANKFDSADALVTAESGVPLVTFYADCVPVYLLDKRQKVLALIHSGWRGTVQKISEKTVQHMIDKYSSKPEDIISAIGPSIRKCHFEVGEEVACEFDERFVLRDKEKPYVDLQGAIESQLQNIGVSNITDSKICTCCNADIFYSHRTVGNKRGTMAAIAVLD